MAKRIVCSVDDTDAALDVVSVARSLAAVLECHLVLFHALSRAGLLRMPIRTWTRSTAGRSERRARGSSSGSRATSASQRRQTGAWSSASLRRSFPESQKSWQPI